MSGATTDNRNPEQQEPITMTRINEILSTFDGLADHDVADVVRQLRALLDTLPTEASGGVDARLRTDLELFLTGYDVGTRTARAEGGRADHA